jgi:hypothetical protein
MTTTVKWVITGVIIGLGVGLPVGAITLVGLLLTGLGGEIFIFWTIFFLTVGTVGLVIGRGINKIIGRNEVGYGVFTGVFGGGIAGLIGMGVLISCCITTS